jgi:hypothetical protein
MTESAAQERIYVLENYLVAFLDVLGQSDKFEQLRLPKTAAEHAAVQETIRGTVRFVSDLRPRFGIQFDAFEAGLLKDQPSIKKFHPAFVGLADSFVTFVPIRNGDQQLTTNIRMFSALAAACIIMLISLASNHALRGGIDIDLATEMTAGEIYGTALMRAYRLESRVADYPRILIGDGLWTYLLLGQQVTENPSTEIGVFLKDLIQKQMALITEDTDGRRILNYLGLGIASIAKPGKADMLVKPAYQFVLDEQQRWLSVGNTKETGRYAILRQYFEERLPLWGLTASTT